VGSDKVLEKRFDGPGKVLEFFVVKSVGTMCEDFISDSKAASVVHISSDVAALCQNLSCFSGPPCI